MSTTDGGPVPSETVKLLDLDRLANVLNDAVLATGNVPMFLIKPREGRVLGRVRGRASWSRSMANRTSRRRDRQMSAALCFLPWARLRS